MGTNREIHLALSVGEWQGSAAWTGAGLHRISSSLFDGSDLLRCTNAPTIGTMVQGGSPRSQAVPDWRGCSEHLDYLTRPLLSEPVDP
jgi:hypothetical protein